MKRRSSARIPMRMRTVAMLLLLGAATASAQVVPNAKWQTIQTEHFRVHFTPDVETQARRAAVNAERAWTRLSADLVPPRGPVDLVIADNVDFTNGYATMYPTNRIVIYAHPPVHLRSLRFYDDWSELVITHELAHIFHLDRTRGWWSVAQKIFGRDPLWFPNAYLPGWVIEGLAVYEESRHTGAGRLAGSDHRMVARAAAEGGRVLRLDELSGSSSRFPGGGIVYSYGSLLIEFLARTGGDSGVRKFVERTSAAPFPWLLNRQSEKSFGITLERAWRAWRDSVAREVRLGGDPLPHWKELTPRSRSVFHPRWMNDSSLVYVGSTGKQVPSVYSVGTDGRQRRIARRSGFDPNVPLVDGSLLFSQLEFRTPYELRSDLWIGQGSRARQLTRGARLSYADARADGRIVAIQATPGSTQLALVTADGGEVRRLTSGDDDAQWAEPRWSPDGSRIAALRLTRGAISEVNVVDTTGVATLILRERAVITGLSWRTDREIAFSSDKSGVMQLYTVTLPTTDTSAGTYVRQASTVTTGIFSPEFSRDGEQLAGVHYRSDGYHVGVGRAADIADSVVADTVIARAALPAAGMDSSPSKPYRSWPSMLPRYWRLAGEGSEDEAVFGAFTSGQDIVGRHEYAAQLQRSFDYPETGGFVFYRYSGLGRPLIDLSISQSHERVAPIPDSDGRVVGSIREGSRSGSIAMTLLRPRMRTFSYVSLGVAAERFALTVAPASLASRLNNPLPRPATMQTLRSSIGWSNTQQTELGISRENGVALDGFGRVRAYSRNELRSHQATGIARGFRGFDLGGWAHHVVAVRVAGGIADEQSPSGFSVGGVSGESLEIIPGFDVGTDAETFGVRGFPAGTLSGLRAVGATVELRGPLVAPSRGFRILPFFLDRSSFALFGEGASAWCPPTRGRSLCSQAPLDRRAIVSVGGEVRLHAAIQYDVPLQLRFGLAAPVARQSLARNPVTGYFTVGADF